MVPLFQAIIMRKIESVWTYSPSILPYFVSFFSGDSQMSFSRA